ncbi:MAG: hypothetical protein AB1556_16015 [Bacillota bacterium]
MTSKDIARLSCKLFSIYTLINAIKSLNYFVVLPLQGKSGTGMIATTLILTALPSTLLFASGIILWLYAGKLANYLVPDKMPDKDPPSGGSQIRVEDIQAVAFSVVGIFILVDAAPKLIQIVFNIILLSKLQHAIPGDWVNFTTITRIVELVIQLILGFWLFFGSRGIVGLLKRLREAGVKDSNDI